MGNVCDLKTTTCLIAVLFVSVHSGVRAQAAEVTITIAGATERGMIRVSLCAGSLEPAGCPYGRTVQSDAGTFRIIFRDVPPGSYAVAAFQDSNGDGLLNRDSVGLPIERYGFSNGVGRSAPPRFARAAFAVAEDTAVRVTLDVPPSR